MVRANHVAVALRNLEDPDRREFERDGLTLIEQRQRARRADGGGSHELDPLGDGCAFGQHDVGEDVHRDAARAIVLVAEDVEVQPETRLVEADLAEDALLGHAGEPVAGARDLVRVPEGVELDVPVPGLHAHHAIGGRSAVGAIRPADPCRDGRALARAHGAHRQDLGARVERDDSGERHLSTLGDALELGDDLGPPGAERFQRALHRLLLLRLGHPAGAEELRVPLIGVSEAAAQRCAPGEPELTAGRARDDQVPAFGFLRHGSSSVQVIRPAQPRI